MSTVTSCKGIITAPLALHAAFHTHSPSHLLLLRSESPIHITPRFLLNKIPMSEGEGTAEMSRATKEILLKVRKMVPPMLEKFHKGTASLLSTNAMH